MIIPKFPRLQTFIQSGPDSAQWSLEGPGKDFLDTIRGKRHKEVLEWFRTLPHFRIAYFQVSDIANDRCFLAWQRDVPEALSIKAAEVWNISPWI